MCDELVELFACLIGVVTIIGAAIAFVFFVATIEPGNTCLERTAEQNCKDLGEGWYLDRVNYTGENRAMCESFISPSEGYGRTDLYFSPAEKEICGVN